MLKLNQQLLQINRNFLICFGLSAAVSAGTAQLLSGYSASVNTTITITVGYLAFFVIFLGVFYFDNKKRYQKMELQAIKREVIKLVSSLGIGEVVYLTIRWFFQFYFLEINFEPYLASLSSEIISTSFYMSIVTIFLKATKTY